MLEFHSLQGPVAQTGSAPRSHRGGQGFKSPQVHSSSKPPPGKPGGGFLVPYSSKVQQLLPTTSDLACPGACRASAAPYGWPRTGRACRSPWSPRSCCAGGSASRCAGARRARRAATHRYDACHAAGSGGCPPWSKVAEQGRRRVSCCGGRSVKARAADCPRRSGPFMSSAGRGGGGPRWRRCGRTCRVRPRPVVSPPNTDRRPGFRWRTGRGRGVGGEPSEAESWRR